MSSAALMAEDGYHARADGLAGLAVVAGAAGRMAWEFPLADPIVGLLMAATMVPDCLAMSRHVCSRLLERRRTERNEPDASRPRNSIEGVLELLGARAR